MSRSVRKYALQLRQDPKSISSAQAWNSCLQLIYAAARVFHSRMLQSSVKHPRCRTADVGHNHFPKCSHKESRLTRSNPPGWQYAHSKNDKFATCSRQRFIIRSYAGTAKYFARWELECEFDNLRPVRKECFHVGQQMAFSFIFRYSRNGRERTDDSLRDFRYLNRNICMTGPMRCHTHRMFNSCPIAKNMETRWFSGKLSLGSRVSAGQTVFKAFLKRTSFPVFTV